MKRIFLSLFFFLSLSTHAQTVSVGLSDIMASLNPFTLTGNSSWLISQHVVEFLLYQEPGNDEKYFPRLAESYAISPDKKTFTFKLRKGIAWQDGTPFTAHDVKFSYDLHKDGKFGAQIWAPMFEKIKEAEVINDYTVQFTTQEVDFQSWRNVAVGMRILSKQYFEHTPQSKWSKTLVGTGPYKVKAFSGGNKVVLVRNEKWWGRKVAPFSEMGRLPEITFRVAANEHVVPALIKTKQLDIIFVTDPALLSQWSANTDKNIVIVPTELSDTVLTVNMAINVKRPMFKNINTRRALNLLWDRKQINQKLYGGRNQLATAPWDPFVKVEPLSYSPAETQKLLRADGWQDTDKNNILEKTIDGKKTELAFTISYEDASVAPLLTLYQEEAKKNGIHVDIRRVEPTVAWQTFKDGRYDVHASKDLIHDRLYAEMYKTSGYYNFSGYSNKQVDQLVDQLNREFDYASRKRLTTKIMEVISRDLIYIVGFYGPAGQYVVSPRMHWPKGAKASSLFYWSLK